MGYRVAVVGATGSVGREMLNILAERQFPLDELAAVASPRWRAVYTSDLIALLDGVAGVSHVGLQAPAADLVLAPRELATLGTVTLTMEVVR
jgi:uncharacterized protein YbjT (DUF2867 family)